MTFVRINGWRLPIISRNRPSKKLKYHGEHGPRIRNRPVRSRRGIERDWALRTAKLDEVCADTLEGLLEGRNHHFSFVHDAWSESGLGPEDGSSWTLNSVGGPLSTRGHYLTVGGGGLTYNPRFIDDPVAPDGGRWTVIWWYLDSGTWVRRALRSDGTKFQDGATTTSTFSEITVAVGGVAFGSGADIADLTLLSFYACDEFLSDEYDWVSGLNEVFNATYDTGYVDKVGDRQGVPTGMAFTKGQIGRAVEGDAAGDEIVYTMDADLAAFGHTAKSWLFWVRVDTLTAGSWMLGNQTAGAGVRMSIFSGTAGNVALFFDLEYATTDAQVQVDDAFATGDWHHIAVTVNDTDKRLLVYLDGTRVTTTLVDTAGAGALADDSSSDLYVLNSPSSTDGLRGAIDDLRVFNRQLSASRVKEIYRCGLVGRSTPGPRWFSSTPRLDMFGDVDGCKDPTEVIGELADAAYVQHGSSTGWVNNDREVSFTLFDVKARVRLPRLPLAELGFEFTSRAMPDPAATVAAPRPVRGSFNLTSINSTIANREFTGPFNIPDASFDFSGDSFTLNDEDVAQLLYGAQGCTIAAWVYPTSIASGGVIFNTFIDNAGSRRVNLQMGAGGDIELTGRSAVADGLQTGAAVAVMTANEWQLVGGTFNLPDDTIETFRNGVVTSTDTGLAFSLDRFSAEGATSSPFGGIGTNRAFTIDWPGRMACVHVWRRVLTPGEILSLYELGKRGVFS